MKKPRIIIWYLDNCCIGAWTDTPDCVDLAIVDIDAEADNPAIAEIMELQVREDMKSLFDDENREERLARFRLHVAKFFEKEDNQ